MSDDTHFQDLIVYTLQQLLYLNSFPLKSINLQPNTEMYFSKFRDLRATTSDQFSGYTVG